MAKIEVNKVELVWPGKYNDDGTLKEVSRVNLPFQVIERVNESRATRDAQKQPNQLSLFDVWNSNEGESFDAGWRNKIVWGDNLYVMGSLLKHFAGKIDLIYIDPPFATGADFSFRSKIGDVDIVKQQSIIEEKAYRDTWGMGLDSYLQMMYERLILMRDLLSPKGSIYIHIGPNVSHYIKIVLDDVFDPPNYQTEIIWRRTTTHSQAKRFAIVHDAIYHYTKSPEEIIWHPQYEPYSKEYIKSHYTYTDSDGRRYRLDNATGAGPGPARIFFGKNIEPPPGTHWRWSQENIEDLISEGRIVLTSQGKPAYKRYLDEMPGKRVQSVWTDISPVNSQALEDTGYDTQKSEALLERIISASSDEGSIVADFFCGSGTTLAVAEKLGRRWIGSDLSRYAVHVTRKRLLDIENCHPFEVFNLGRYERQHWQEITFSRNIEDNQKPLYEYIAFILRLYGAQPISGTQHLHGKKEKALVHIGAVDAPVTIDEVYKTIDECLAFKQKEVHVLGWEWEMGLNDLMVDEAKRQGVKLLLLQIPREVMEQQAVDKGDIHFFELAYLEVDIETKEREVQVVLKDFVIPNTELIPEDVREEVQKWSDYIDYWAVDWDFQEDTFIHGWVTYRTHQERSLPLKSDKHTYEKTGKKTVVVKVIDIFGNDTTQSVAVAVK